MFVTKKRFDEVVAERDALQAKLDRYTKGLTQGAAASAAKRRAAGLANLHAGVPA